MLNSQDNETLVRVGPGTAMGQLMRLYWIPFLASADVERDGQPHRVRLLGEDLVAFRDSEGQVGLVDQACPHRGAPLLFGRNEEGGLRCVYHGWKFSVDGSCQEMPAEPENTPMLKRVRVKAYPVQERNGVLWTYMGPDAEPPPLPSMEWNMVPPENAHVSMRIQECNWLQAVDVGGAGDKRPRFGAPLGQTWGLHIVDVNIVLGNLLELVDHQSAAWRKL